MDLFMTADVKFPWCTNKMYNYLCLSVLLLCTLKGVHPAFPRTQAVKDLDGLLQIVLPALWLLLYGGVCAYFCHSSRLINFITKCGG